MRGQNQGARHARRLLSCLPEPGERSVGPRGLGAGDPHGRGSRGSRLRLDLDGGAPLHRLHDVPRPGAVPDLGGRAHEPAARHRRHRAAVARPDARRRAGHHARQPLGRAHDPRHRPRPRPRRVRGLPGGHELQPGALPGVRQDAHRRARAGLRGARRRVRAAAPPRHPPRPGALVQGPHLRRRGVARGHAADGAARHRPAGDPPEAVGDRGVGLRRVPRRVGQAPHRAAAPRRCRAASAGWTPTPTVPRRRPWSTSATTTAR